MNCQDFRKIAELFLDDELKEIEYLSAAQHLEFCTNCQEETDYKSLLKTRLRSAVKSDPNSQINRIQTEDILSRARAKVIDSKPNTSRNFYKNIFVKVLLPSAAGLLITLSVIFAFIRLSEVNTPVVINQPPVYFEENSNINATKIAWRELMTGAIDEHQNCTLNNLKNHHNEVSSRLNISLDSGESLEMIVQNSLRKNLSTSVKLADSHICESNNKRYTHLIFKNVNKYISVMISSFEGLSDSEETMYCESNKNYQVACFTAMNKTVFVISDLSEPENVKLARSISPEVRQYFKLSKSNL